MPNLLDVVPLNPVSKAKPKNKLSAFVDKVNPVLSILTDVVSDKNIHSKIVDDVNAQLSAMRKEIFLDGLTLPADQIQPLRVTYDKTYTVEPTSIYHKDTLTYLAARPTAKLEKLRHVADMLNMVIMPYGALDPRSLSDADYYERRSVNEFVADASKQGLALYVIAPLSLYTIAGHIKVTNDNDIYSGVHENVMTTVQLQLPMFTAINEAIGSLDRRVSSLEQTAKTVTSQIKALTDRLTQIEEKTALEMKRKAMEIETLRTQIEESRAMAATASWIATDPLVFAVKRGTSLISDGAALVGPAWGPDFSNAILEVSGLSVIAKQRQKYAQYNN